MSLIYKQVESRVLRPRCFTAPVTLTRGDLLGAVWRRMGTAGSRTGRPAYNLMGAPAPSREWRPAPRRRVKAYAALKWRGNAFQAGNGAANTPLSRRWRDHVCPCAPADHPLSAATVHRSLPNQTNLFICQKTTIKWN